MVGVNRAPIRICHSGRVRDSGRDIFENKNLNKTVNKKNLKSVPGFRFGLTIRVGPGSGVATKSLSFTRCQEDAKLRFRRIFTSVQYHTNPIEAQKRD